MAPPGIVAKACSAMQEALLHLLHADVVTIEVIAVGTQGHFKLEPVVRTVWLVAAYIVVHTGRAADRPGEAIGNGFRPGDSPDALDAVDKDAVPRQAASSTSTRIFRTSCESI